MRVIHSGLHEVGEERQEQQHPDQHEAEGEPPPSFQTGLHVSEVLSAARRCTPDPTGEGSAGGLQQDRNG